MFCFSNFDPSTISTMEKGKQVTWGCGFDGRLDLGEWVFEGHLDLDDGRNILMDSIPDGGLCLEHKGK